MAEKPASDMLPDAELLGMVSEIMEMIKCPSGLPSKNIALPPHLKGEVISQLPDPTNCRSYTNPKGPLSPVSDSTASFEASQSSLRRSGSDSTGSYRLNLSSRLVANPGSANSDMVESLYRRGSSDWTTSYPTTLMLKNVPTRIMRGQLVNELVSRLPPGSMDFIYLPVDFKSKTGFGYAFVNCTSAEIVDVFVSEFHKRRLNCSEGFHSKPIEVTAARVQGFTANVNRLISSPVLFNADDESLPVIFSQGGQVAVSFKNLMQLHRASVLFHSRPSVEDLMAMIETTSHEHTTTSMHRSSDHSTQQ